ncbi:glycosyltransferase family 4 protein [Crateriforma spongiae]|uniref:glycosyltransferase family 4 protein n=1 Tax=Crateriforma spongiae TaxID=2724528 RepID=UPI0039AF7E87
MKNSMGATCEIVCRGLEEAGHEVRFCCINPTNDFDGNISLQSSVRTGVARLDALQLYRKVIRGFKGVPKGNAAIVNVSQEYIIPAQLDRSVVIIHDAIQSTNPRSWRMKLLMQSSWFMCRRAKVNVSISRTTQKALLAYGVKSEMVYLNSFDTHLFESVRRMELQRKWDGVWCGTLARHKRIDLFLRLAATHPGQKFAVIVPDCEATAVRLDAPDNVDVLSGLDATKYAEVFAQSKVFVSTSEVEGFGRPAMEALLAGTAVLLSDIPIYREVYSDCARFFRIEQQSLNEQFQRLVCADLGKSESRFDARHRHGRVEDFVQILEDSFA